jgi:23S rRNA (pseudouridine1915-N3)-methyltransferase
MRVTLIQTGTTRDSFISAGVEEFRKRLVHYVPFSIETISDLKNSRHMTMKEVQEREGAMILKRIRAGDHAVLLDERGKMYDSIAFAKHLNCLEGRVNHLLFVIGGAYGFNGAAYHRADERLSLSRLTFSHQMVRLIFMEQLYRAYTILKGEPYHHA